jgi:Flp pilus assembly protein TadD
VLLRTGRAEEGRAALELFGRQQAEAQALGQREFELDALRRRASTHALAGEHSQAVAVLEQIATVDPQHSRSHRDLGVALLRAKRPAEAIEPLRRAQQLEETADGYAHLADAYAAAGNSEESSRMRAAYSNAVRRARLERLKGLTR